MIVVAATMAVATEPVVAEGVGPASDAVAPTGAATATPPSIDQLARSVVKIWAVGGDGPLWAGSGTVISADGLILTNAHVAVDDSVAFELHVAVTESTDAAPEVRYRAELVASDETLDLAMIRAVADFDGNPYQPNAIPPVPIGNSDDVQLGDELLVLGFPGIGGDTITFTTGQVSGFTGNPLLGNRAWIKTDATIAGGNSGGLAANAAGEIVGVPSRAGAGDDTEFVDCRPLADTNDDGQIDDNDTCIPIGGFLNGVRPINHAVAMLQAVQTGVEYQPVGAVAPSNFDVNQVEFGPLAFSAAQLESRPPTSANWLPSGATDLCAWLDYSGMADGLRWDAIWALDGAAQDDVSYFGDTWSGGTGGAYQMCVTGSPLPEGIWDLTLNVEGTLLSGGYVGVGDRFQPVTFTFTNGTDVDVCYLQMTPRVSTFWGEDLLGPQQIVAPAASVSFDLPPTTYDLRGLDCDANVLFEDAVELNGPLTYTYQPGQAPPPATTTPASSTPPATTAPGPTTTAVSPPPTTAVAPAPASTTVAPASTTSPVQPTTPSGGTTAQVDTADGPRAFTCDDIVASVEGQGTPCGELQQLFDAIVGNDENAFNAFVNSGTLGTFSTAGLDTAQVAYAGFAACAFLSGGTAYADYDAFIREAFTMASPADSQQAWDTAGRLLCSFLAAPA